MDLTLSNQARARRAYIIGQALDCKEEYDPEVNTLQCILLLVLCSLVQAEIHLAAAVKLDPTVEYWNAAGHCLWKKVSTLQGDLTI